MSVSKSAPMLPNSALISGLVTNEQLEYALRVGRHRLDQQGVASRGTIPDRLLADILVEQEILTAYQADQLLEGRTKLKLGPYWITDWIGQGGMGRVYKGVHQLMGRVCAVKVLMATRSTAEARDSFAREIRMQAKLDNPYLVRAFDAGQDGSVHYLVTEYVPGMDLRRLVRSRGPLPIQHAAKIILQAALGLDYAHKKGLVHRDVKPGNILVTPEGEAKVSDVGLAGFAHDLMNDPRAGKIVGTTDYLSPEQIRTPLEIEPTSDIYSLGCSLYYAVCGKVPFPGGDTASKMRRHIEETPWHPRNFAPDVPEDFVDIIADMMEKDHRKRIASAAEVAARLEPWSSDSVAMGAMSMTRSPWMAPPPPSPDDGSVETHSQEPPWSDESSFGGGQAAQSTDGRASRTDNSVPVPGPTGTLRAMRDAPGLATGISPQEAGHYSPPVHNPRLSTGMVVALTVAICLPPALLIGAILGYLVAQR